MRPGLRRIGNHMACAIAFIIEAFVYLTMMADRFKRMGEIGVQSFAERKGL